MTFEEFLRVWLPTIGGLLTLFGIPWLAFQGRKLFADKDHVVSPLAFSTKLEEGLKNSRLAIINEINTMISTSGSQHMMRLEAIARDISNINIEVKESTNLARAALDEARKAVHATELLARDFAGYKEVVDLRLKAVDNLERRRNADK